MFNISYTQQDHEVWRDLITQQLEVVKKVACSEFLAGLEELDFSINQIPKIEEVSKKLYNAVGWTLVPVNVLVPNRDFFKMLTNKQFPVIGTIRHREEIDFYTDEAPDIFHELFGHCPMIVNKRFAEMMHKFGKYANSSSDEVISLFAKIYWITFEFGIIDNGTTKIFGAGILPSKGEINQVINSINTRKVPLNSYTKIEATIQGGVMQPVYYKVDSLEALYTLIEQDIEKLLFVNMISPTEYCNTFLTFQKFQAAY
jgi:phenylalanine-4-hydroxylase